MKPPVIIHACLMMNGGVHPAVVINTKVRIKLDLKFSEIVNFSVRFRTSTEIFKILETKTLKTFVPCN